jgi:hypothetical protein
MPNKRRFMTFALSIVAGVLLVISGTSGPISIYQLIIQKLPTLINDSLFLSIAILITLALLTLALLGGFTVAAGGYLILKNHVSTGKFAIGLGSGAGIPWLILILYTLIISHNSLSVLAQHSILGWIGIITAFAARFTAR